MCMYTSELERNGGRVETDKVRWEWRAEGDFSGGGQRGGDKKKGRRDVIP